MSDENVTYEDALPGGTPKPQTDHSKAPEAVEQAEKDAAAAPPAPAGKSK